MNKPFGNEPSPLHVRFQAASGVCPWQQVYQHCAAAHLGSLKIPRQPETLFTRPALIQAAPTLYLSPKKPCTNSPSTPPMASTSAFW
ncbi:hypothetical protein [Kingella oralis]|uniref:hypothetical protein n=1 Tax=Kingella oralis TaxID=505 RepID=UPI002D7FF1FF|nr:hypothetical protein [Kingella oralis]